MRMPTIEDRFLSRHWEGDLTNGKVEAPREGTSAPRASGYLSPVKVNDVRQASVRKALVQRSMACRWRYARA